MDLTVVAYTASLFAVMLAVSTYTHWGVAEVHAYTIPPYLEERGYSSRIVANQVVDAMRRIQIEVAALDQTNVVVQGQVQPVGQLASYFGLVELLRATEGMVGLGPSVIELEVTQHGDDAHWRIRGDHAVRGHAVRQGHLPVDDPDTLIDHLGLQVVGFVSPFTALSYHFVRDSSAETGQYDTTIAIASELLLECDRQYWTWACTPVNRKNAYLLRGLAHLYSGRPERAFDDLDAANRIGVQSALGIAFYGDAFAVLGNEEAAQAQYRNAKKLDPSIGERFLALAQGYAKGGHHRLAGRRYATAAKLGMNSEELLTGWADSLMALGWYEEALEKYGLAENLDPETDLYVDRIDRAREALGKTRPAPPNPPVAAPHR